jgi:hypothetical protein
VFSRHRASCETRAKRSGPYVRNGPQASERPFKTSPSEAAEIDDAGIVRVNGYFEQECPTPRVIDVEPPAAIHPANIPEAAVTQDSLSIPARDGAPVVEIGAYINFNRDSTSGRWRSYRNSEAESQNNASEQVTTHRHSPHQRYLCDR